MGILLFVLKYIVYFLASEDDNGVFLPAKIMASPFKNLNIRRRRKRVKVV